jgi:hypothetical protein
MVTLDGGFGLEIGFIDLFNTQLKTTPNHSAIADLHTSQITATLLPGSSPLWTATPFQKNFSASQSQSYITTDGSVGQSVLE